MFSRCRHRHALKRVRGEGGKFNSNDNKRSDSGDLSDGYDDSDQVKKIMSHKTAYVVLVWFLGKFVRYNQNWKLDELIVNPKLLLNH